MSWSVGPNSRYRGLHDNDVHQQFSQPIIGSTDKTVTYCVEVSNEIEGKAATSTLRLEPGLVQTLKKPGPATEVWSETFWGRFQIHMWFESVSEMEPVKGVLQLQYSLDIHILGLPRHHPKCTIPSRPIIPVDATVQSGWTATGIHTPITCIIHANSFECLLCMYYCWVGEVRFGSARTPKQSRLNWWLI